MPEKDIPATETDFPETSSEPEGQLAVDVYHTDDAIVIRAPIAGVRRTDISISVTNDVITIKGRRALDDPVPSENYFTRECYWGAFSRSIVLPSHVLAQKISAQYRNGVLKIIIPKSDQLKTRTVKITPT